MADETTEPPEKKKGLGLIGWLIVVILALGLGGAGFFATYSGMADDLLAKEEVPHPVADAKGPEFLELDPMLVTVGGPGSLKQLRFRAFLQTAHEGADHVPDLQPRILDIFATYLRALSVDMLEDPSSLLRIRAQLLRRVQLLAGPEAVSDLLIIDFVIT
ncbi:flagellar basal body-associated protein FliL [Jannaschia sp. M317]|uniref:flagellar basal body-associated FliL family protein n=1 Tax=Jannaschia sp. M317 TaxID=2867011 RepID=UPI0021A309C0|nr:flagellar basal body-associated FliL family protein [Jannaschia sp. M317]UWQ18442.1 flagellar basal body-associated FliL family protein [Jannaschia sp. M317]